ncbi:MAG: hypothetical protein NC541_07940 [bacterium]|nr:hypothetical protein [bacterium]
MKKKNWQRVKRALAFLLTITLVITACVYSSSDSLLWAVTDGSTVSGGNAQNTVETQVIVIPGEPEEDGALTEGLPAENTVSEDEKLSEDAAASADNVREAGSAMLSADSFGAETASVYAEENVIDLVVGGSTWAWCRNTSHDKGSGGSNRHNGQYSSYDLAIATVEWTGYGNVFKVTGKSAGTTTVDICGTEYLVNVTGAAQQVEERTVYVYAQLDSATMKNTEALKALGLKTNGAGWITVGKVRAAIPLATEKGKTLTETEHFNTVINALGSIEYFSTFPKDTVDIAKIEWKNLLTSEGANDFNIGWETLAWHLDGYLDLSEYLSNLLYTVEYVDSDGNKIADSVEETGAFGQVLSVAEYKKDIDNYVYEGVELLGDKIVEGVSISLGLQTNKMILKYRKSQVGLDKTSDASRAAVGETVHYTITVKNTEAKELKNVVVQDTLSGAGEISNVSGAVWNETEKTFTIASIGAKGKAVITYDYTIAVQDAGAAISNTAKIVSGAIEVTGKEPEPVVVQVEELKGIQVTAKSLTTTYDGTVQTVSGFEEEKEVTLGEGTENKRTILAIPVKVTAEGQATSKTYYVTGLTSTASGTNVADSKKTVIGGTAQVFDENGKDVTGQFTVTGIPGTLTINKRTVTLTSAILSKEYDGTPLTNGRNAIAITGDGWVKGEGATYSFTGTQTLVGSSENTFSYTLKTGTDANNYEITMQPGTLTVSDRNEKYQVTVKAKSHTEPYDGTVKTVDGFEGEEEVTFSNGTTEKGIPVVVETTVDGKTYSLTYYVTGLTSKASGTNVADSKDTVISGTAVVKDVAGNDVTDQFEVTKKSGSLTISKRAVTLTSATLEKEYDGTALTNGETELATETGWAEGEGATYTFTGTQTLVGESANAFSYKLNANTKAGNYDITKTEGTLTVIDRTEKYQVTVTASSLEPTYDGTEHTVEGFVGETAQGIPVTVEEEINGETVSKTYYVTGLTSKATGKDVVVKEETTETGETVKVVVGRKTEVTGTDAVVVKDAEGNDVTAQFDVTVEPGYLTIKKQPVTLTSATLSKAYNGSELTNGDTALAEETGWVGEDGADYEFTGSQTLVGESANAFTYTLKDGTNADNYDITKTEGTLTVRNRPDTDLYQVTVTAESLTDTYDGTPKTVSGFKEGEADVTLPDGTTVKGIPVTANGKTYYVTGLTSEASGKNVEDSVAEISVTGTPAVLDAAGNDVTAQFNVTITPGHLTIEKRHVTLISDNLDKEYDGKALTNGDAAIIVSGDGWATGEGATYTFTGTQTLVGFSANEFTYKLNANTKEDNYTIVKSEGTLTVNNRDASEVTVTAKRLETFYDGTLQTVSGFENEEELPFSTGTAETPEKGILVVEDGQNYYVTGLTSEASGTIVTDSKETIPVQGNYTVWDAAGNDVTDQFNVKPVSGFLTIKPRPLTITAKSATRIYTGEALTANEYTVEEFNAEENRGLVSQQDVKAKIIGSQTLVGSGPNIVGDDVYDVQILTKENVDVTANYVIERKEGVLEVTDVAKDENGDPIEVSDDLVVTKVVDGNVSEYQIGQTVNFTITVKNIYDEPVTVTLKELPGVTFETGVNDAGLLTRIWRAITAFFSNSGEEIIDIDLGAGEEETIKASYVITEADIKAGSFKNEVTASYKGHEYQAEATAQSTTVNGELTVTKTADSPDRGYALGEDIVYTITVKNTGNVTVTDIVVKDELTGDIIEVGTLAPQTESAEYKVTYTVTEEDIKAGQVFNRATVTGKMPENTPNGAPENPDVVPGEVTVGTEPIRTDYAVSKVVLDPQDEYDTDDVIRYQITVSSNANVTLHGVTVTDLLQNAAGQVVFTELNGILAEDADALAAAGYTLNEDNTVTVDSLEPGETFTLICEYTVQEADAGNAIVNGVRVTVDPVQPTGPVDPEKPDVKPEPINPEPKVTETDPVNVENIYSLVIHYVYANGVQAAPDVRRAFRAGDDLEAIYSPTIGGYTPNYAFLRPGENGMPARDVELTVVYTLNAVVPGPAPVPTPDPEPTDETPAPVEPAPIVPVIVPVVANVPAGGPEAPADPGVEIEEETAPLAPGGVIDENEDGDVIIIPIEEEETPLANFHDGHICCILHFLLMLAALIVAICYTKSMKKHQKKIAELMGKYNTETIKRKATE